MTLKPCPFCGANEEDYRRGKTGCPIVEELTDCGWRVTCYTCRYSICWEPFATDDEAIAAWNTRTLPLDGDVVERVARALCEQRIREVRRHDTSSEKLEAMMPDAVDYSWKDFEPAAIAALSSIRDR